MKEELYTFPKLIKSIRQEAGLTQAEFADKMGVSSILVAMIESGQRGVSRKFIEKLAELLKVSPASITPFLYLEDTVNSGNIGGVEKQLLSAGTKLQTILIQKKAKNLKV